tara:strand:+ start:2730 stop:3428 length:699 start_codon:yes stop_codon:yes gene_type:complete
MGYLDNSTTNIILDAVLTDKGRQFLSRNDGSFAITKFAFSDDDVDYTIIKNYGRIVGKEKVEKNTPIMEGITNENVAQKYRLISFANQDLFRLPKLSLTTGATNDIVSLSTTIAGTNSKTITLSQEISGQTFDRDFVDESFVITVNNRFLSISGDTPVDTDDFQNSRYFLQRDAGDVANGSKITFTLALKTVTNTLFQTFGKVNNKNTIVTSVKVQGINTGTTKEFEVQITK